MGKGYRYSCEHDDCDVVHEDWECPLCLAETKIKKLEAEVKRWVDSNSGPGH